MDITNERQLWQFVGRKGFELFFDRLAAVFLCLFWENYVTIDKFE